MAVAIAMININLVEAVTPLTRQWIPSVGSGSGINSAQWRTTVWIHNPSSVSTANVEVSFFERGSSIGVPLVVVTLQVLSGEAMTHQNFMSDVLRVSKYGSLRFVSDIPVSVRSRIYNANSPTPSGAGTAGQAFDGINENDAVGVGQSVTLQSVPTTSDFRFNFGFIEVGGTETTVRAQRINSLGQPVGGDRVYLAGEYQANQFPVSDLSVTTTDIGSSNDQIKMTVTQGGRIIAFGSLVDNKTGDPTTVTQESPLVRPGVYSYTIRDSQNGAVKGTLILNVAIVEGVPTMVKMRTIYLCECGRNWYFYIDNSGTPFSLPMTSGVGATEVSVGPPYVEFWLGWVPTVNPDGTGGGYADYMIKSTNAPWSECNLLTTTHDLVGGWSEPLPAEQ